MRADIRQIYSRGYHKRSSYPLIHARFERCVIDRTGLCRFGRWRSARSSSSPIIFCMTGPGSGFFKGSTYLEDREEMAIRELKTLDLDILAVQEASDSRVAIPTCLNGSLARSACTWCSRRPLRGGWEGAHSTASSSACWEAAMGKRLRI